MKRLVRFFVLLSLRVAIVCGLSVWALSQFTTPGANWQRGFTAWDLTVCEEGVVGSYLEGDLVSNGVYLLMRPTSWRLRSEQLALIPHDSLLGYHVWRSQSFGRIGIRWPALLVTLILCYAGVHGWGAVRRRASLRRRLEQAAT